MLLFTIRNRSKAKIRLKYGMRAMDKLFTMSPKSAGIIIEPADAVASWKPISICEAS